MVARIRSGKSLKGAINYNEHKVKEGKAELLMAKGFSKDAEYLKFNDKVNRLQKLANLNTRVVTHCLHISLNFDASENLNKEKLQQIANEYMDKISFGKQPFLVYEHRDAAHQHVHIVTTNIQSNGKRISLHNLGRLQSEKARKEIEINFGLVKAGDKKNKSLDSLQDIRLEKMLYGKVETKRAISNIVTSVVSQYKFASLPELNAVLMQYNVMADRGADNTRMFQKNGLQYSILDEQGNKVGKPIKASSIYGKPILSNLESKYEVNRVARLPFKQDLKNKIDLILDKNPTKQLFVNELKEKGVIVVFRTNDQNFIYGITYVDHTTKSVFNGSDLGKEYSAAGIRGRLDKPLTLAEGANMKVANETSEKNYINYNLHVQTQKNSLLDIFTQPSKTFHHLPYEFRRRKRKKRR
jgi:hypothetical protein